MTSLGWVARLPEGWSARRLRDVVLLRNSNVDKLTQDGELPVRLVNYTDVYNNEWITPSMNLMSATATPAEVARFRVLPGDVIITKDSESWNDIAVPSCVAGAEADMVCGYHLALLRPCGLDGRYLLRAVQATGIREQFWVGANGVTRFGLTQLGMKDVVLPVPPRGVDSWVADFLDQKTAAIDALIAKKERLIELLQEKRQALITQAVTKGLDPKVPMKDSGIEWLGEIPEHWRVLPIKRIFDVSYGLGGEIDRTVEEGTKVISLPNVTFHGSLDVSEVSLRPLTDQERQEAILKKGDLLFNWRNGSVSHVGKTALFDLEGEYAHVSFLLKLRPRLGFAESAFYWMVLNGLRASGFFASSKFQVNVTYNQTELRRVPVPCPPLVEQKQIAEAIMSESGKLDCGIELLGDSIEKLKEYRQALISAAVTGQLSTDGGGCT